jgi:hypothetical protein
MRRHSVLQATEKKPGTVRLLTLTDILGKAAAADKTKAEPAAKRRRLLG